MTRIATLFFALCLTSPALACSVPDNSQDLKRKVAADWNAERSAGRLSPLARERTLEDIAQGHACDMAGRNVMSHVGSNGADLRTRLGSSGYRFRVANENIGDFVEPDRAVRSWMGSAAHRSNVLARGVVEFGIGIAQGQNGRTYWAIVSAARR
jgi:uncharacterized protein YkwD